MAALALRLNRSQRSLAVRAYRYPHTLGQAELKGRDTPIVTGEGGAFQSDPAVGMESQPGKGDRRYTGAEPDGKIKNPANGVYGRE